MPIIKEQFRPIPPFMEHYVMSKLPGGLIKETYTYSYEDFIEEYYSPQTIKNLMRSYGVWWQDKGIRMERQRHGIIF